MGFSFLETGFGFGKNGRALSFVADEVAPILSNPAGAGTGPWQATLAVDTNEGNGTLIWGLTTASTAPLADDLENGVGAVANGIRGVFGPGTLTVIAESVPAGGPYYPHFMQRDASGNLSAIVSGTTGFVVEAAELPALDFSVARNSMLIALLEEF